MRLRNYPQNFLMNIFVDGLKSAFASNSNWEKNDFCNSYEKYRQNVYYLRRRGYINIAASTAGKKFLKLTKKGELELLMAKARLPQNQVWDRKWRIVIFDIPEDAGEKRDQLRRLLKDAGFVKLQASVYVSPYPLNREAVIYLKTSGLINYIRLGRIDELDDDRDLIKYFKLTSQPVKLARGRAPIQQS